MTLLLTDRGPFRWLIWPELDGAGSPPSTDPLTLEDGTTPLTLEDGTTELTLEG